MRYFILLVLFSTCALAQEKFGQVPITLDKETTSKFENSKVYKDSAGSIIFTAKLKYEAQDFLVTEDKNPIANKGLIVVHSLSPQELGLLLTVKWLLERERVEQDVKKKVQLTDFQLDAIRLELEGMINKEKLRKHQTN